MTTLVHEVRLTKKGFLVCYQTPGYEPRVITMKGDLPPGHELLRAGAVVEMVIFAGTIAYVCEAKRQAEKPVLVG